MHFDTSSLDVHRSCELPAATVAPGPIACAVSADADRLRCRAHRI
jgi:hypothetical protein